MESYLISFVFFSHLQIIRRSQAGGILLNPATLLLISWLCFADQHQILRGKIILFRKASKAIFKE